MRTLLLLFLACGLALAIIGIIAWRTGTFDLDPVRHDGGTSSQPAVSVLQKSQAAQSAALAALGPNTTLHATGVEYREQIDAGGLPFTTIGESFWTFDATGMLSAYSSTTKGTDGTLYQHSELVDGAMVHTDVKSGQTYTVPGYTATADSLRAVQIRVITAMLDRVTPSVMTKTATVNGVAVFVIDTADGHGGTNRDYIGQSDYWPVRSEELAPDGHVTAYTLQTVLEVLPGAVTAATATP
jgi:hypothetical protein